MQGPPSDQVSAGNLDVQKPRGSFLCSIPRRRAAQRLLFIVQSRSHRALALALIFEFGGTENLSILVVNVLAVNHVFSLDIVSKNVFCTRYSEKESFSHSRAASIHAFRAFVGASRGLYREIIVCYNGSI